MMKVFGIWGQGICLVIFQVGVFAAPDYSWMTYSWVEEGAAAKRVEASINKHGPEKTLLNYKRAAEEGDAEAQFFIAYGYMEGELFDRDDALALSWLIKSAEQGYSYAQSMLGMAYFEGNLGLTPDVEEALSWLSKAAGQGDVIAEFALAGFYLEETHKYSNREKGIVLLEKTARKGYADAQTKLACCFANGTGVEVDMKEAGYWMRQAAEKGQPYAQFELGLYYYHGRLEGGKNLEKAVEWIRKAARQGHPDAEYTLAGFYARGEGVAASPELALTWGLKAAEHGNVQAQLEMARSYAVGHGVKKDQKEAVKWFSRAAKNGDSYSQEFLMYVFADGDGVEANLEEAANWGLRAAINGRMNAQIRMVHAYGQGLGVAVDHGESYAWAIITDHNGESKWKEMVEPMFSVDDKVRGYRRARELEKEMRALKQDREANAPVVNP